MLYEIWRIDMSARQVCKYGSFTNKEYPLLAVLSATIFYRDDVVSMDLEKLQVRCEHLNFCADEDERYEIREVTKDQQEKRLLGER